MLSIRLNTGSHTGDFNPISSRPCRAHTRSLTRHRALHNQATLACAAHGAGQLRDYAIENIKMMYQKGIIQLHDKIYPLLLVILFFAAIFLLILQIHNEKKISKRSIIKTEV